MSRRTKKLGGKEDDMSKFKCPCCGFYTLESRGNYEICPVCFWEDDEVQESEPDMRGGANQASLNEARENFNMNRMIWNGDLGDGTYQNPILYTDYSDPDAIRVGEDYFMIASSFSNAPGLPLLHSRDLVNWKLVNYILPEIPEARYDKPIHGCGVWAPAIRYHEGTYFACFPMPDEGIYMSTATDPFGGWSRPVNIRPGAGWIDPCPFWDEDGRAYLVAGVAKSRIGYKSVLHMVEMQPDGMGLIGEEVKVFDGNENDQVTIEGPKLYKRNGWYYIFAPAGGVKTGWQTVLRSRNIFGPYEYRVVMRQGDSAVNGPHQGAWVDTVTGEDWFLHFQDVYSAGRIIHLQPMFWKDDWPVIGSPRVGKEYGVPVFEYRKPNVGAVDWEIVSPKVSDDFSDGRLGLQWQWNANPKDGWYCVREGNLRLNAVSTEPELAYGNVPNLLLQKWAAPEFACVTKLHLRNLASGDCAGIISMGMEYGLLEIRKEGMELNLSFVKGVQHFANNVEASTDEVARPLACLDAEGTDVLYVKYTVERCGTQDLGSGECGFPKERVSISYSLDGEDYGLAGEMIAKPGRWVGVKNGVFCIRQDAGEGGYLEVESVIYE